VASYKFRNRIKGYSFPQNTYMPHCYITWANINRTFFYLDYVHIAWNKPLYSKARIHANYLCPRTIQRRLRNNMRHQTTWKGPR
jgi:hypothetical protein